MNALEQALYDTITKAASVTKLLTAADAVHADEAPENANFPHVVFGEIGSIAAYSLVKREWEQFVYQIKGVTKDESAKLAKEIGEALDALLSDGTFTIPGHQLMYSRKITDMPPLTERIDGARYNHRGGHFEIWVGPEP